MSLISLFLLLGCVILIRSHKHDCVHNQLRYDVQTVYVDYGEYNDVDRRRLNDDAYENIRIRPYWDEMSGITDDQEDTAKKLTSAALSWIANATKVIPAKGNLKTGAGFLLGGGNEKCGEAVVPPKHIDDGVSDTDIVIYVTTSTQDCSGSTVAWAHHCAIDQNGRPISGTINICQGTLNDVNWKMDVEVLLHEILHVLVFSPDLFTSFGQTQSLTYNEHTMTWITSPKVKEIAKKHYGCSTLEGAPIEDDGNTGSIGAHWEELYLYTEVMQAVGYGALSFMSEITMALMEDSGWYQPDYNYAEPFNWGKDEGCTFFTQDCVTNTGSTSVSNFPQYFCDTNGEVSCTHDHSAPAVCFVGTWSEDLLSKHQYFSDSNTGGYSELSEFCPFRLTYSGDALTPPISSFEYICWDSKGISVQKNYESYGSLNARCINLITDPGYQVATTGCLPIQCNNYNSNTGLYSSLTISLNTHSFTCTTQEKGTTKTSGGYTIECPNVNTICIGESPFQCRWGYYSSTYNQCICSPGYTGDTCSDINDDIIEGVNGAYKHDSLMYISIVIIGVITAVF